MLTRPYYPSAIRLALPAVQQHANFTCGPAVLHSILAFYGKAEGDHSRTAAMCNSDPQDGTTPKALAKAARQHGLNVSIVEPMTDDQLRRKLDSHKPVILNVQAHGDGHYVAAVGYDHKCVYVMDPMYDGHLGYLSWVELASRWWDIGDGKRNDRLAIVFNRTRSAFGKTAIWVKP